MSYKSAKLGCEHASLRYNSTQHATQIGYARPTAQQRIAAATASGVVKATAKQKLNPAESKETFPAPLILPNDDLAPDPTQPPQSLRSWIRGKHRNKVTHERRTIYLAAPPAIASDVDFIKNWSRPWVKGAGSEIKPPDVGAVLSHLEAFYHGLSVKLLPSEVLSFTSQVDDVENFADEDTERSKSRDRRVIGLATQTSSGCKGVRTRSKPRGDYSHETNPDDLLEAAIWALPDDAYALLLLVEHDMYEDEEDEFVCGRAYGGSRVAVITTARYHPALDVVQDVERGHDWPAAHCQAYLQACCNNEELKPSKRKASVTGFSNATTPLEAAVFAHNSLPSFEDPPSAATLSVLWLGRVCRTAGHELGHCLGIAHCVYYACSMQGNASIIEDARQPPYLCPVDLAKVLRATDSGMVERYQALLTFCNRHKYLHLFAAYGAWIRERLEELAEQA
jgi:archaemetzincin